jgi:hypothetical protein
MATQIYTFILLVGGGACLGFISGVVAALINSSILFTCFRMDLGTIAGVIHLSLPTLLGLAWGGNTWKKRMRDE